MSRNEWIKNGLICLSLCMQSACKTTSPGQLSSESTSASAVTVDPPLVNNAYKNLEGHHVLELTAFQPQSGQDFNYFSYQFCNDRYGGQCGKLYYSCHDSFIHPQIENNFLKVQGCLRNSDQSLGPCSNPQMIEMPEPIPSANPEIGSLYQEVSNMQQDIFLHLSNTHSAAQQVGVNELDGPTKKLVEDLKDMGPDAHCQLSLDPLILDLVNDRPESEGLSLDSNSNSYTLPIAFLAVGGGAAFLYYLANKKLDVERQQILDANKQVDTIKTGLEDSKTDARADRVEPEFLARNTEVDAAPRYLTYEQTRLENRRTALVPLSSSTKSTSPARLPDGDSKLQGSVDELNSEMRKLGRSIDAARAARSRQPIAPSRSLSPEERARQILKRRVAARNGSAAATSDAKAVYFDADGRRFSYSTEMADVENKFVKLQQQLDRFKMFQKHLAAGKTQAAILDLRGAGDIGHVYHKKLSHFYDVKLQHDTSLARLGVVGEIQDGKILKKVVKLPNGKMIAVDNLRQLEDIGSREFSGKHGIKQDSSFKEVKQDINGEFEVVYSTKTSQVRGKRSRGKQVVQYVQRSEFIDAYKSKQGLLYTAIETDKVRINLENSIAVNLKTQEIKWQGDIDRAQLDFDTQIRDLNFDGKIDVDTLKPRFVDLDLRKQFRIAASKALSLTDSPFSRMNEGGEQASKATLQYHLKRTQLNQILSKANGLIK